MLLWIYLLLNPRGSIGTHWPSVEKNLTVSLLNNYQRFGIFGRPVSNWKDIMTVQYGLQLIQILDLDENKQILRTNCWSMHRWSDKLLSWNPADYSGITEIRVFPDQIWTPDIKLYNFADVRLKEARVARVVVKHTGRILWVPQALFKSTCAVEITYFPFDIQICMLEFGSWAYDINQLKITWWVPDNSNESVSYIDFSDYTPSNEWRTDGEEDKNNLSGNEKSQIKSVMKHRIRTYYNSRGDLIQKDYPVLRYLVRLKRNPSFYVSILVLPCILLSSLTLVVFWLPPESPAKMMLGMNSFVAFFVLLLLLAESTPSAVKKFPLIGAYFCLNMIMITLSTFLATIVINYYFKGDYDGPLPPWIRRVIVEGLGRLLFVRQHIPLAEEANSTERVLTRAENGSIRKCRLKIPNLSSNKFLTSTTQEAKPQQGPPEKAADTTKPFIRPEETAEDNVWQINVRPLRSYSSVYLDTPVESAPITPNPIIDTEDSPLLMRCHTTLENDIRELKRYIRIFVNRQKENNRKNLISMEWRTLALVLDRLFFVIYISSILIAVVTCMPKSTEPELPSAYKD